MTPTIVLYDVDGTLISTGGAGRRAIERAFEAAFERTATFEFSFAGMTDRAIVRGGLRGASLPDDDDHIDRVMDVYLEVLRAEVRKTPRYLVHPGIVESIEQLLGFSEVAVGLGTGNIEAGARIKLERAGLNRYFDFGGFGCDAEDRAELIGAGARRGAHRLGRTVEECRLIVIGDTPKDAAAAHANGGDCLAVATGGASREALEACGARWVVSDLTQLHVPAILE